MTPDPTPAQEFIIDRIGGRPDPSYPRRLLAVPGASSTIGIYVESHYIGLDVDNTRAGAALLRAVADLIESRTEEEQDGS